MKGAEHGKERYRSRSQSATRAIEVVGVDAGVGDDAVVVVVVAVVCIRTPSLPLLKLQGRLGRCEYFVFCDAEVLKLTIFVLILLTLLVLRPGRRHGL